MLINIISIYLKSLFKSSITRILKPTLISLVLLAVLIGISRVLPFMVSLLEGKDSWFCIRINNMIPLDNILSDLLRGSLVLTSWLFNVVYVFLVFTFTSLPAFAFYHTFFKKRDKIFIFIISEFIICWAIYFLFVIGVLGLVVDRLAVALLFNLIFRFLSYSLFFGIPPFFKSAMKWFRIKRRNKPIEGESFLEQEKTFIDPMMSINEQKKFYTYDDEFMRMGAVPDENQKISEALFWTKAGRQFLTSFYRGKSKCHVESLNWRLIDDIVNYLFFFGVRYVVDTLSPDLKKRPTNDIAKWQSSDCMDVLYMEDLLENTEAYLLDKKLPYTTLGFGRSS